MAKQSIRELKWCSITEAPNGQRVLLWNSGTKDLFGSGIVTHNSDGSYEVYSNEIISIGVTHYAIIEGPGER